MGYRVCISTGIIHACGEDFKKVCARSKQIQTGNYKDFRTKGEAEALVRAKKKPPKATEPTGIPQFFTYNKNGLSFGKVRFPL